MAAPFAKRANLPVAAFVVIALAVGLALFAIQVVLRLELMANGLQYICAPGGPEICYLDADFATAVSQVPMVFFVTLVLVPACLALLVLRPLKTLPPTAARWGVLAMWFAFACYLSVPLLGIYFSSSLSSVTSQTGWTLYPPLSSASLPAHLAGRPNALQMNSYRCSPFDPFACRLLANHPAAAAQHYVQSRAHGRCRRLVWRDLGTVQAPQQLDQDGQSGPEFWHRLL